MGVLALIVVLQIVLIEVGGDAFQTTPLTGPQWGISIGLGLTSIPLGWVCRLIPIRSEDDEDKKKLLRSGSVKPAELEACCSAGEAATVSVGVPPPPAASASAK